MVSDDSRIGSHRVVPDQGLKKYFLCVKHYDLEPGDVLYAYAGYDHGHCHTEQLFTGQRHLALTKVEGEIGSYYVIPEENVIEILQLEHVYEEDLPGYHDGWSLGT